MTLRSRMVLQLTLGLCFFSAPLFLPAGTWRFWQAWVLLAILSFSSLIFFIYFGKRDPQLIERRLQTKEKITEQRWIIRWLKLVAFLAILIPGLDHLFGWTRNTFGDVHFLWCCLLQAWC